MQPNLLGKKIKELRLQKKMTQAELAGKTITRNMLSQIENGLAQPSVSTIVEIAEKLGAPTEYFFSETMDLPTLRKMNAIGKLRRLYAAGDYEKVMSRLEALDVWDDETEELFAKAAFQRGLALYREGYLSGAMNCFEKALSHVGKTVYKDDVFSSVIRQYLRMISLVRSEKSDIDGCKENDWMVDIAYITAICDPCSHVFLYESTDPLYARHLAIRREMRQESSEQSREEMMQALQSILSQTTEEKDAVFRYYVLSDLETLAQEGGDYKCAYECSSARLALSEKMSH